MTSAADIKNRIVGKVESLSHVAVVKDYDTTSFDEYPAATVMFTGGSGIERQNVKRVYTYNYEVSIRIEQGSNFQPQKAERIAIETVDELLTAFNNDVTLSGLVTVINPVSFDLGYETADQDFRTITVTLEAQKLESIIN